MPDKRRAFNGKLKLLKKKNKYLQEVEIMLLNDKTNTNNWRFTDMEGHKDLFAGTPVLVAYKNNGKKIGGGHDFDYTLDAEANEYTPSFVGSESERIIGMISENTADIRTEMLDDKKWIIAKAYLWKWYAKEAVNKIVKDTKSGKPMSISIEAIVNQFHMEGDVEVEDSYEPLGTTILGDGHSPSFTGANIRSLSAKDSEFKELKLRAASYIDNGEVEETAEECAEECEGGCTEHCSESDIDDVNENLEPDEDEIVEENKKCISESSDNTTPNVTIDKPHNTTTKGVKKNMTLSKKRIAELEKKFEGYRVLDAVETESGIHVCLMSNIGETAVYVMDNLEDAVTPSKIQRQNAQVVFAFGEEEVRVDAEAMTDVLSADLVRANTQLEEVNGKLTTANETIESMVSAEKTRRVNSAKAKATATLVSFNANRAEKVEEKMLESVLADIEAGLYTNSVDADGNWTGEAEVEGKVLAICATEVMKMDEANVQRNSQNYIWDNVENHNSFDDGSVEALLESYGIN